MTTDRKRGYLYILLAAMLYSTTEVALKALGGAFAPMQVTVERVLLGAAALMAFALYDLKSDHRRVRCAAVCPDVPEIAKLPAQEIGLRLFFADRFSDGDAAHVAFADGGAAHGRLSYIDYLLGQSCVRGGAGALHPA